MKKINNKKLYKRNQRRSKKREIKKKKRTHSYTGINNLFERQSENFGLIRHEEKVIKTKKFPLNEFLNKYGHKVGKHLPDIIEIPKYFILEKYQLSSFNTITRIRKALMEYRGEKVIIDFSKCKKVDYSCIFLLLVILMEYTDFFEKLDKSLITRKTRPQILIKSSTSDEVNGRLMAGYIIPEAKTTQSFLKPFSTLNFIKGKKTRKSYTENLKGPAATAIRKYINDHLIQHGFRLDEKNSAYLDGIISEVLNNAEDHSEFDTWYVSGNIFQSEKDETNDEGEVISEINLAFLNFGYSIYEGFEKTKYDNQSTYGEMNKLYSITRKNMSNGNMFSKEEMFTLYALQEGISRLNYQKEDRGTGTMKILKSFINLGDYVDTKRKIEPSFLIYSGNVFLKCDHKFRPQSIDGVDILALNEENDLSLPPVNSNLKKLKNPFPGTFLVVKLYLSKSNLERKFIV